MHPRLAAAAAAATLLLVACDSQPRTLKSKLVEEGRPGQPGYRSAGTFTWSSDPDVEPPTPELPSRLEYANDRTREADRVRERDRGRERGH